MAEMRRRHTCGGQFGRDHDCPACQPKIEDAEAARDYYFDSWNTDYPEGLDYYVVPGTEGYYRD